MIKASKPITGSVTANLLQKPNYIEIPKHSGKANDPIRRNGIFHISGGLQRLRNTCELMSS